MNQFYLKHMEETGLKEVHQLALTHMVENVDCSTANTATFEPVSGTIIVFGGLSECVHVICTYFNGTLNSSVCGSPCPHILCRELATVHLVWNVTKSASYPRTDRPL